MHKADSDSSDAESELSAQNILVASLSNLYDINDFMNIFKIRMEMIYGNNLCFNHTRRGDIVVDKKDALMGFGIYIKYSESTILFSGELEMTSVKNDNVNYKPIMNIPDNKRMTLIIYNQNDYLNMRDKVSLIQTGTRTYERKQFYPVYALDNNLLHLILAFVGKYMGIKKVIKRLTVSENMNLL